MHRKLGQTWQQHLVTELPAKVLQSPSVCTHCSSASEAPLEHRLHRFSCPSPLCSGTGALVPAWPWHPSSERELWRYSLSRFSISEVSFSWFILLLRFSWLLGRDKCALHSPSFGQWLSPLETNKKLFIFKNKIHFERYVTVIPIKGNGFFYWKIYFFFPEFKVNGFPTIFTPSRYSEVLEVWHSLVLYFLNFRLR